jgi:hypothetical protein
MNASSGSGECANVNTGRASLMRDDTSAPHPPSRTSHQHRGSSHPLPTAHCPLPLPSTYPAPKPAPPFHAASVGPQLPRAATAAPAQRRPSPSSLTFELRSQGVSSSLHHPHHTSPHSFHKHPAPPYFREFSPVPQGAPRRASPVFPTPTRTPRPSHELIFTPHIVNLRHPQRHKALARGVGIHRRFSG